MRLLARRDYSSTELRTRLLTRFSEAATVQVIDEFQQNGWVDDTRTARRLVEWYATERRFGPVRIQAELRRRGLPLEAVADLLADLRSGPSLSATARAAAMRYLKGATVPDERTLRRLAAYLARRGFPSGTIRDIVSATRRGQIAEPGPNSELESDPGFEAEFEAGASFEGID